MKSPLFKQNIRQITESRWFADKESEIEDVSAEDIFIFSDEIQCIIAKFRLKRDISENTVKRYFIPMLISSSEISDTEHSFAFQQALFRHYNNSSIISGSSGGFIKFNPLNLNTLNLTFNTSHPLTMTHPSSNILTVVNINQKNIISKTYKDLRGDCGIKGRIWLPNPEAEKYEVLTAAAYPNIPEIYAIAYYQPAFGKPTPFNILMEAIQSKAQVGEIFSRSIQNFKDKRISAFSKETAKTIAQMHAAFLSSKKSDYRAVSATDDDILRWHDRINNNFHQALSALKKRSSERPSAKILSNLIQVLESFKPEPLSTASVMKAQIHGDLHADQGLVADRICWIDFEGPPAKEPIEKDQDLRENLLLDLAGMVSAFRYMAHVRLYELSGLNYQRTEDHEKQRQASLEFAGIIESSEKNRQYIYELKLWLNEITKSFVDSYLDEAVSLNIQGSILKDWDRISVINLVNYWVKDRAIHELRYETYGRDWGWEAIPASRIFQ